MSCKVLSDRRRFSLFFFHFFFFNFFPFLSRILFSTLCSSLFWGWFVNLGLGFVVCSFVVMEPRVGNKFRLGRKIGSGSFGEIFLGL